MKKVFVLFAVSVFSLSLLTFCGPAAEEKEEKPLKTKEKAANGLVLKIDGEKVHYDDVQLSYDEMFGKQLTVNAFLDADGEEVGTMAATTSFFSINIEDVDLGKMDIVHITYKDYFASEATAKVNKFDVGSGMYGPVVESAELEFSAKLRDNDGKKYSLTGKYIK